MTAGTSSEVASSGDGDSFGPGSGADVTSAAEGNWGTTTVLPRVVERVAVQAVREVAGAAGSGRQVLGHAVGSRGMQDPAMVRAHVDGDAASLEVEMTVIFPAPVLLVTRCARHHIIDRIVELTGLRVRRVDITVVGMTVERPPNRRVR